MTELVYDIVQLGKQSGSFTAPGAAVPATFLYPISDVIHPDLDLGATYPKLDRGRNVRNLGGSGYHGVRKAGVTVPSEVRFQDIMPWLEMSYAGSVTPTGAGPYVWLYPFEAVAPTLKPYTIETGTSDLAAGQNQLASCLVNSITLGFSAVTAGQASPWTMSADVMAFDRAVSALTGSLNPIATPLETVQGHLTQFYEGTIATAFASLAVLGSSLRSYTQTATRSLIPRAYGSASDLPTKWGFTEMSTTTFELVLAVSTTAKTDFHDVWNTSGASLGERRIRVKALGTGTNIWTIDARAGLYAVPWDDGDGERVYKVTGEFADDTTLAASHTISISNSVSAIP
jgi:hypothetical protein